MVALSAAGTGCSILQCSIPSLQHRDVLLGGKSSLLSDEEDGTWRSHEHKGNSKSVFCTDLYKHYVITAGEVCKKKTHISYLHFWNVLFWANCPRVFMEHVLLCIYTDSNAVGSQAWLAVAEATSEIIFMVFITIIIRVFTFILHTGRYKKGTRVLRNLKFLDFRSNVILWLSWTDLLSSCVH